MSGFKVVIAGGGIAAVEGLLRLRRLVGDSVEVTLIAPEDELRVRPLAVDEPFARRRLSRFPLRRIAQRTGAEWVEDALEWLDPDGQRVHTSGGATLPYDALLLAFGGRLSAPFQHVTLFDDSRADETFRGLVQDVEGGYTRSIGFVLPEGSIWPLPAYELALMTAERASSMGEEGLAIMLVTSEPTPLAALGDEVSREASRLLDEARVRVRCGARPDVPAPRRVSLGPSAPELEVERIVTVPRIDGRPVRNVPAGDAGFIPIDERCRVRGLDGRVLAAGDATDFPLKHGGLGAQQADVAAGVIAALAGAAAEPEPLRPVARAVLHTGSAPLYLTTTFEGSRVVGSEVSSEADWPAEGKIDAEELPGFLQELS